MKSFAVLALFVGMFMATVGIYEQRLREAAESPKVEYRFIPRTAYEEQVPDAPGTAAMFSTMFEAGDAPRSLDYSGFRRHASSASASSPTLGAR